VGVDEHEREREREREREGKCSGERGGEGDMGEYL